MIYAYRFDQLVSALRRATALGRRRMLATHARLIRKRIRLPSVPEGYRVIAGELVPVTSEPIARGGHHER
jgi:hypothetical protein